MDQEHLRSALAVLTVDPAAMGGLWLRSRAGPVRTTFTDTLAQLPFPMPLRRLPPNVDDQALYGGLDVAETLHTGKPVLRGGLLDSPRVFVLPMAERCTPKLGARLAQALDQRQHALVALDEAAEAEEGLPFSIADRLGLFIDLTETRSIDPAAIMPDAEQVARARDLLPQVQMPHDRVREVVEGCQKLYIMSLRAPMLALVAARIIAALDGRIVVEKQDVLAAAQLTLAHRAIPLQDMEDQPPPPPPPAPEDDPRPEQDREEESDPGEGLPSEIVVEAVRAMLPDDLLKTIDLRSRLKAANGGAGSGEERIGNRRGRPLPSRKGRLEDNARIDLVATLRCAAPWQGLRRKSAPPARKQQVLLVDSSDIHLRRRKEMSDRVLIFTVDASGSAAMARLSEAKGAVELLLARAYSQRDHVSLVSFRGEGAQLLLAPSRSLTQTKRHLSGLPGGGGTPLASGLEMAMSTAKQARSRGMTPTIALLTDGRGNIALDGSANRALAEEQATQMAKAIRAAGTPAVIIDTAMRPNRRLQELAQNMGGHYIALPRANAHRMADVLGAALEA
ncbi:protoporphyrin IX magnesium-chelatase [Rhodobacter aestuarii]|uniref:Mg-protoporphyrin IX chelatase n=1 Tax=Rhodobacter aestuarii TaxID=453582 RepID=A0A1N7MKE3_9RHOB|nr:MULTISPECIES: magnesium chelatase subunit D [Rhodobacter]PTV96695.1 protoporphyrin IX magnesium-chelatase [Rhodobacter aestuarii]SIS86616.1 protoporphyrin IX magnesium-chelatase [Rhodobacter aestuarii]SOB90752.1 protoporphyrin IX magnesium-chelatase [Rhodobacter sp. JA431]